MITSHASQGPNKHWNIQFSSAEQNLGRSAIKKLLNEEIAVIVLKNALSKEVLSKLTKEIYSQQESIEKKQYINGALTTFGPYLAKHLNSLNEYFNKVSATDTLFKNAIDLRTIVRQKLCAVFKFAKLEVAQEKNGQYYSPAVIRIHSNGVSNPLHNDNIMRDASHTDLILKNLLVQLSCVVCIQECDQGGELSHYRKRWQATDETHKILNGLGYKNAVVEAVENCLFKPETGDVYLMDPTHYHEIHEVLGKDRITMGFFIGFFDQALQNGIVWS